MKNALWIFIIVPTVLFVQCQTNNKYDFEQKNIYWGDIHNHCNIGYAQGSLERAE
jgi:hypothetical protein